MHAWLYLCLSTGLKTTTHWQEPFQHNSVNWRNWRCCNSVRSCVSLWLSISARVFCYVVKRIHTLWLLLDRRLSCETGRNSLHGTIPKFIYKQNEPIPEGNCSLGSPFRKMNIFSWVIQNQLKSSNSERLVHLKTLSLCK